MSKQISLTRGLFTIIDDEDFEWLNQWKWYAHKAKTGFYVYRSFTYKSENKIIKKNIAMHRLLMNIIDSNDICDHIDGNPLNNQKYNLRKCTKQQNNYNHKNHRKNKTSKYLGVCFFPESSKWRATICKAGKVQHIGLYYTEEEAAKAYDNLAKELHGEFASLNFG